jgi:hypothetical protein
MCHHLKGSKNKLLEVFHMAPGKFHTLEETSDKEICQAVIISIAASENIEINSRDDVNEDIPITKPHPTQRGVLKAVSTISRYTDRLNGPIVCQYWAHSVGYSASKRPGV